MRDLDGRKRRERFFASRPKWSRWGEVTIVSDEGAETLVRTPVTHCERMGGVPLASVFDRPTTVAVAWDDKGVVTRWNQTFLQVMGALGWPPSRTSLSCRCRGHFDLAPTPSAPLPAGPVLNLDAALDGRSGLARVAAPRRALGCIGHRLTNC